MKNKQPIPGGSFPNCVQSFSDRFETFSDNFGLFSDDSFLLQQIQITIGQGWHPIEPSVRPKPSGASPGQLQFFFPQKKEQKKRKRKQIDKTRGKKKMRKQKNDMVI